MPDRFAHCGGCGTAFAPLAGWPRTCASCGLISYRNPIPVSVLLVPVGAGLLAVRRAIPPQVGKLALPGGFMNFGESWQEAGAREVKEETGVILDAGQIREFRVESAPDGTLLVFGLAPSLGEKLPVLAANEEVSELAVITANDELAFSLHTRTAQAWFRERAAYR